MSDGAPLVLNVSHYMPPDHGTHVDFIQPWARAVETAAAGAVSVVVHDGNSPLGLLDNQYAQVVAGRVDVAHSPASLPGGRFPLTVLLNLPFMIASAAQGTRMLWALLEQHLAAEYADLHVLALHTDSGGVLHTRNGPVTKLEQLAGLRLRCPAGPMEAVLRQLGAIPVPLTPPNIHAAAKAGEIDGAVMAWDVIAYTRTDTIFRFHTDTKLYASPLYFVMNRARWLSLPEPVRQAIDAVSGRALIDRFGGWWQRWEAAGRSSIDAAHGHIVSQLTPEELQRWQRAAAPAIERYVDDLVRNGLTNARDVYQAGLGLRGKFLEA
jgi:TRAP-type C4-dicarboxylate transport system substrate-binding protein